MKIKEVINEAHSGTGSLTQGTTHTLRKTYILPSLKNQDFYMQYRMGLAMAAARSESKVEFDTASTFGENMTVTNYTDADEETLLLALKLIGEPYSNGAKQISTDESSEADDVNKVSPLKPQGPIKKK